ncbi:MAG: GxxExxY protein [Phycisphaerales bacterium]|nr:GxxExxY protein [Phycisphaerales bacterium]MCI0630546.1 GxxExxY protein [Phycisphaerales bacterium]MCI0676824.1 GxxExxY protein [Phycisphaerales bacterium]
MTENDVAKLIVDAAFKIHRGLGPGLLESVYEAVLSHELVGRGLRVDRQRTIPIQWDGIVFDEGFRADLIVDDLVIVEIKSVVRPVRVFKMQLLTYLRLTGKRLGILVNFGEELFKDGIFRVVNNLTEASSDSRDHEDLTAIVGDRIL